MRGGLSGVVAAAAAARGAAAFAEGARTNLMIFFSFAFIPPTPLRRRRALLPYQGVAAYSPASRARRRADVAVAAAAAGRARRCEFRLQTPAEARAECRAADRVGGPGRVGRVCGGTHSLSLNCTNMQFYFLGFYPLVVYC